MTSISGISPLSSASALNSGTSTATSSNNASSLDSSSGTAADSSTASSTDGTTGNSGRGTVSVSTGIISGTDYSKLIKQLIAAERSGEDTRINSAQADTTAKITALGSVSSAFSKVQQSVQSLQSEASQPARKTSIAGTAGYQASADTSAALGHYDIQVKQLATAQKQMSAALPGNAALGHAGTLSFSAGKAQPIKVEVSASDTLSQLADKINQAAGGHGVSAAVVNVDNGNGNGGTVQRLALTALNTGTEGNVSVSGDAAVLSTLDLGETTKAQDASVVIDGQTRTSSSNTLTDLLGGVTLKLTGVDDQAHALSIDVDTSKVSSSLNDFVSTYNDALKALSQVSAFTPGKDGEPGKASALTGDSMVRNLTQQLRDLVGNQVVGLDKLGVSIATDGSLSVDANTLNTTLGNDPSTVTALFSDAKNSLGSQLGTLLDGALDKNTGLIAQRNQSYEDKLSDLSDENKELDQRMEKLEASYTTKFANLESLLGKLSTTSNYLTQQIDSLNKQTK